MLLAVFYLTAGCFVRVLTLSAGTARTTSLLYALTPTFKHLPKPSVKTRYAEDHAFRTAVCMTICFSSPGSAFWGSEDVPLTRSTVLASIVKLTLRLEIFLHFERKERSTRSNSRWMRLSIATPSTSCPIEAQYYLFYLPAFLTVLLSFCFILQSSLTIPNAWPFNRPL